MSYTIAIIGFGGMGNWHCDNIREKVPQLQVKGIYDIREEAMIKAAEKSLYVYPTLEDLLDDDSIDVVTIATPNHVHRDLAVRCLTSGKHVVCEKPVTMDSYELEDIMHIAQKQGRLFSIHQNRRWDKDFCIIKQILRDKSIGVPYFIESRVQGSRGAMHGWRGHKVNGGGMLYDWGVHLIDQMLDLIPSPVVSVTSHLLSLFSQEVDDNIKILLRFENGVSALCEMSTNCFIPLPRWHISCSNGTAVVEDWACRGKMVQLSTKQQTEWADDIVYTEAGPTRTMAPRPVHTTHEMELPEVKTDWADYYQNIVQTMDKTADLIVMPEQALRVMKVIDVAFESQRQGVGLMCRI